mmetsp:Transcript_41642/g.115976  ORF Transcript_41642/g.115976 Transcript_41642/m.115976 type:complete len:175 (-) Transcript_41642:59-583(-)
MANKPELAQQGHLDGHITWHSESWSLSQSKSSSAGSSSLWKSSDAGASGARDRGPSLQGSESRSTAGENGQEGADGSEGEKGVAPEGGLLSVGSAKHAAGNCQPCILMRSSAGCSYGEACNFCHQYHSRKKRATPSRCMRERQKRILQAAGSQAAAWAQRGAAGEPRRSGLVSL